MCREEKNARGHSHPGQDKALTERRGGHHDPPDCATTYEVAMVEARRSIDLKSFGLEVGVKGR